MCEASGAGLCSPPAAAKPRLGDRETTLDASVPPGSRFEARPGGPMRAVGIVDLVLDVLVGVDGVGVVQALRPDVPGRSGGTKWLEAFFGAMGP